MKHIYLGLFLSFIFFSCNNKTGGDFTIVKGKVTDETGNPAPFAKLQVSAIQEDRGVLLLDPGTLEFAQSILHADATGNYEYAFFNDLSANHYIGAISDSLYNNCNTGRELKLNEVNEDYDFSVFSKSPLLRVNFLKQGEESEYKIQITNISNGCRHIYTWDILQFEEAENQQVHLLRALPNDSLTLSVISGNSNELFSDITVIQDTSFIVSNNISTVDFILY